MASVVQICNMALAHIGAESLVSSIDPPDGSAEAGYCNTFFSQARVEALEFASWPWAMSRVQLAPVANPSDVWQYAYAKPSDCLTATRILSGAYVENASLMWPVGSYIGSVNLLNADRLFSERGSSLFEIEGQVILTNEPQAVLKYKVDVTDTTQFSGSFTTALSYLLASFLAGPIIKGSEGAQAAARLRQTALGLLEDAASNDANNSSEKAEFVAGQIAVRA